MDKQEYVEMVRETPGFNATVNSDGDVIVECLDMGYNACATIAKEAFLIGGIREHILCTCSPLRSAIFFRYLSDKYGWDDVVRKEIIVSKENHND